MLDRLTAPPISGFPILSLPGFDERKLQNGIRLLTLNSGEEAVTRLSVIWPAGLIDSGSPAAYSLTANMLTEGCDGITGKDVSDILESNGAWFKVFPSQHSTLLTLHSLNHTAPEVFPLVSKIISSPDFPEETLEALKKKNAAEKELATRKPSYQATLLAREALYGPGHPLASMVTPDDILAVTRDDLVRLHSGILLANKPAVFLSGKITPEIEQILEEALYSIPFEESATGRIRRNILSVPDFKSSQTCRKEMPESLQTGIRIQIPTIERHHPDYEALRFTVVALGGYFGSRLMANIREDKGYTYGIGASLVPTLEGTNIVINCECDNRYTEAVVKEVNREISRMANEDMEPEEVETVRNILISNLAGILDSPFSISSFREQAESLNLTPDAYAVQFSEALSMTPGKIRETAARYLQSAPCVTALAGGKPG